MKDNTILTLAALGILGAVGIAGLVTGQEALAYTAAGAAAGLVGGHLNGSSSSGQAPP